MSENVSFGQIVKERRHALGLTQAELARRAGCAPISIRKIEGNTLRPSVQLAELLAHALNIPEPEQAGFVRLARQEKPPSPIPTPSPAADEIGQPDLSGRSVKGFELGERIGSGGFGVVYHAMQPSVQRDVAVKIILPRFANHPTFIRRFEAEAQLVAQLEHPHIVPLYDYWREPDAAYLIMRLLRGGSLEDPLQAGPLALVDVQRMMTQIGLALHAAHRQGVVHRDVKPANILLDTDQNAYLADFGIAKNLAMHQELTTVDEEVYIGSPAYVSPEQIMSEPVRPSSDIYCFGLLLYEMLTGQKPFQGPTPLAYFQQHLREPVPLLQETHPDLPPVLDVVVQRATAKQPEARYQDMATLLAELELGMQTATSTGLSTIVSDPQSISRIETAVQSRSPQEIAAFENPFRGLRSFGEADADKFFGRDTLVQELLGMLSDGSDLARFVAVIGPSGSGKSSVVKAGLIPTIRRGGLPDSDHWFIADMTPSSNPFEEVVTALKRVATHPHNDLLPLLQADQRGLLRAVRHILPNDGTTELLLLIDQFEELFTLVTDETVRSHFLGSLVTAVLDPHSRLRVVITLRADFTDRPLQYVDFGELMQQRLALVLPLTPDELTQAITQPLHNLGMDMEPQLTATIMQDVGNQPGKLPLLQYALTELFEQRNGRILTLTDYHNTGGVTGALAARANEIYTSLDSAEQQATRQLFLRLITLGEGNEDTRRRVLLSELSALNLEKQYSPIANHQLTIDNSQSSIVNYYGRYRLLTFDHDPRTREATVEVAHEALLREWPRLRAWLDQSRDDVRLQRLLATAVAEWKAADQDDGFLLRGTRLDLFSNWADTLDLALTHEEQIFLESSLIARKERSFGEEARQQHELETAQKLATTEHQRAAEQEQAAAHLRKRAVLLTGALIVAAFLATVALFYGNQSNQNAQIAAEQAGLAVRNEAQALDAANARATAQIEAEENEQLAIVAVSTANAAAIAEAQSAKEARVAQNSAEEQTQLARSRELAALAISNAVSDPELAILLAQEALSTAETFEARNALHNTLLTSRLRGKQTAHDGWIEGMYFSPNGTQLATTSDDGFVKVWNADTWELLFETPIHNLYTADLNANFNLDGTQLATLDAAEQFNLTIWDTATWQRLDTVELPLTTTNMRNYFISPDWSQLAVGYDDGSSSIWDLDNGQQIAELQGNDSRAEPVYSPSGSYLATFDGREAVNLWDAASATFLRQIVPGDRVGTSLAFSPDDRWLALIDRNNFAIQIWNLANLSDDNDVGPTTTLRGHANLVWSLAFSPNSRMIASVGRDQTARVWDVLTGNLLFEMGHNVWLSDVAFSPDSRQLLTGDVNGNIRSWDLTEQGSAELFAAKMATDWFEDAALSPDGNFLALGSDDGTVGIWDIKQSRRLHLLEGHDGWVIDVDFDPQSQHVASVGWDGIGRIWDVKTGAEILRLEGHEDGIVSNFHPGVLGVAYNPNGQTLATAGTDGTARIWDAATGEELQVIEAHNAGLTSIAYSPDGALLVTGSDEPDASIKFWNPDNGLELFSIAASHGDRVWGLDFHPDGNLLATSGGDGTAKIWAVNRDPLNAELLTTLTGHNDTVWRVRFNPDGQILATTAADIAYLWDVSSLTDGTPDTPVLPLFRVPGFAVAFSADGSELYTGDSQGILRAYILNHTQLIELANSRVTRNFTPEECTRFNIAPCPQ